MTQSPKSMIRTRRQLLKSASCGFGYLALTELTTRAAQGESVVQDGFRNPLASQAPHLPARAKRVIFMFMQGGPSHVDTFDYKRSFPRWPNVAWAKCTTARRSTASCCLRPGSSPSMGRVGCRSPSCIRIWRSIVTSCACSMGCTPTIRRTLRQPSCYIQVRSTSYGLPWERGSFTDWGRKTKICQVS